METPELLHVALNDGSGPTARLVPCDLAQQWLESPDFFDSNALWHEEWRGMTPAAVAPAGPGFLAVDLPTQWVGYAILGAAPFRWVWRPEQAVPHDHLLAHAWREGRLLLKMHARHEGAFAREAERISPLPDQAPSLATAVHACQAVFLETLCADGSSQPAQWRVDAQVRQVPPRGWSCSSFFNSGVVPASGNWAGFAKALVDLGWGFSEAERVAWRRYLVANHYPATMLDELLASRAARQG